jgi:hypothetical protein
MTKVEISPVVYQFKIQNLSKVREEKLDRVFLETNRFCGYNKNQSEGER